MPLECRRPGTLPDKPFIESFNGKLWADCLDQHHFATLEEAKVLIEAWRREYNKYRPHRARGRLHVFDEEDRNGPGQLLGPRPASNQLRFKGLTGTRYARLSAYSVTCLLSAFECSEPSKSRVVDGSRDASNVCGNLFAKRCPDPCLRRCRGKR